MAQSSVAYRYEVFAHPGLTNAAKEILRRGVDDEVQAVLQALRFVLQAGTNREKLVAEEIVSHVPTIAMSTKVPSVATLCVQPLIYARNPKVTDVLIHFIRSADDAMYNATQISNWGQDIRTYGVDVPLRAALYDALKEGPDERTRKRIADSLASIRY